ncbi:MAG: hypothetical protein JJU06_15080 [Ectothiorhodospiraceae bacterium]|nr:hypothetical protein [Ectothiorhodospiraceae bacterium]MCH8504647.1 hypothetical protein [Ectothiorhodospiraceae bacterium]
MRIGGEDLSATALLALLQAREISPTAVVQASLDRIDKCNAAVNAVCTVAEEQALAAARQAERRLARGEMPLLLGLPVGIKDITDTAGIRTTYGSTLCFDHVPERDAEIVRRFKAAGAIVIGKTNTPEFAAGANTVNEVFGATRNPWNTALSAGGSTGGGAAALAAGMIALASGTDLGGSLRVPAAFCGVVGLRPTPGLVPSLPATTPWDTLQVDGPMAMTAEDVWLALQALAGPCADAPVSVPAPPAGMTAALDPDTPRRAVYIPDIAGVGIDPVVADRCRAAAMALQERGWEVEELELDLSAGRDVFITLRGEVIVAQLLPYLDRMHALNDNLRGNLEYGLSVDARQLARAQHQRAVLRQRVLDVLQSCDVLLTPCAPIPPFPVTQNYPETIAGRPMRTYIDWVAPTFVVSLLALPAASVPAGLTDDGLPVGLQVVGAPWAEHTVLSTAAAVQRSCPLGPPPEPGN